MNHGDFRTRVRGPGIRGANALWNWGCFAPSFPFAFAWLVRHLNLRCHLLRRRYHQSPPDNHKNRNNNHPEPPFVHTGTGV